MQGTNLDNVSAAAEKRPADCSRRSLGWRPPQTLYDEYMTAAACPAEHGKAARPEPSRDAGQFFALWRHGKRRSHLERDPRF